MGLDLPKPGSTGYNISVYAGIMYPLLFFGCIIFTYVYSEPKINKATFIFVVLCYFCTFGILLIVPADIASVIMDRKIGSDIISFDTYLGHISQLNDVYNAFFVSILILTSLILSWMEYYETDGYFTYLSRMKNSTKRMLIDLILPVPIALIVLGILIGEKVAPADPAALELSVIIVTNIIYEAFLMFLLGYGLVEFPRGLWLQGNLKSSLTHQQTVAYNDFKNLSNSQIGVGQVVANILKTEQEKRIAIGRDPALKAAMDILLSECPPDFRSLRHGEVMLDKDHAVTIHVLAQLRTSLNETIEEWRICQAQVEHTKLEAYRLMNIEEAKFSDRNRIRWTTTGLDSSEWEYRWYITIRPILMRVCGVFTAICSIFALIGILATMAGNAEVGSPFFIAVHRPEARWISLVVFIYVTLGYAAFVAYWSLLQMQFGGMMKIMYRRTSGRCMSFSARMCARLAAPLAFFYLSWLAESGLVDGSFMYKQVPPTYKQQNVTITTIQLINHHNVTTHHNVTETITINNDIMMRSSFSNFYQIYKIGVFKTAFRSVFPVFLLLIMILVIFNVLNWILVRLRLSYMQMGTLVVPEDQLIEGKRKLEQYKVSTERTLQRGALKAKIQESMSHQPAASTHTSDGDIAVSSTGWPTGHTPSTGPTPRAGASSLLQGQIRSDQTARADVMDDEEEASTARAAVLARQPREINGTIERKEHAGLFGMSRSWKPYRCTVMPPGILVFQQEKQASDETGKSGGTDHKHTKPPPLPVDLSLVISFTVVEEKKTGSTHVPRLNLELSDDIVKLKFKSVQDMTEWRTALVKWKEWNIDMSEIHADESRQLSDALNDLQIDLDDDEDDDDGKRGSPTGRPMFTGPRVGGGRGGRGGGGTGGSGTAKTATARTATKGGGGDDMYTL